MHPDDNGGNKLSIGVQVTWLCREEGHEYSNRVLHVFDQSLTSPRMMFIVCWMIVRHYKLAPMLRPGAGTIHTPNFVPEGFQTYYTRPTDFWLLCLLRHTHCPGQCRHVLINESTFFLKFLVLLYCTKIHIPSLTLRVTVWLHMP